MVKTGKPRPVNVMPRYPNSFQKIERDIRLTPLHTRIFHIRDEAAKISGGDYFSVKRIVDNIIAADYKKEVMDAAREVMLYISSDKLEVNPFDKMNFEETPEPFYLGALFEVLPQPIAVELFWKQYSPDKKDPAQLASKNACETLLRFSKPVKAAEFMLALNQVNRKGALELVDDLLTLDSIQEYKFRNYEVRLLLRELPKKIFPQVGAKPKKKPQKAGKKSQKKKRAKKTKASHPPRLPNTLIEISRKRIETNLSDLNQYADNIREGYRPVVFHVLEIVTGMDFDPRIMTAAREALFPIKSYQKMETDRPFQAFGFPSSSPTFYVGALFELLRPSTAVSVFRTEFLKEGDFFESAYRTAGKGLLRFSTVGEVVKFARALEENTNLDLFRFLTRCQNSKDIRDYPHRRYEVEHLRRRLGI
jgi:hypothetical protein